MNKIILLRCSLLVSALLLGACAHHRPEPDDIPPGADFTANILADGTKLFVFSVRMAGPGGPGGMGGGMGRGEGGMGRGEAGMEGGGPRGSQRRDMAKSSQQGLQAMLAQNGYCREGYVVLEQFEQHNKYIIRGECRDGADDRDRERFGKGETRVSP